MKTTVGIQKNNKATHVPERLKAISKVEREMEHFFFLI